MGLGPARARIASMAAAFISTPQISPGTHWADAEAMPVGNIRAPFGVMSHVHDGAIDSMFHQHLKIVTTGQATAMILAAKESLMPTHPGQKDEAVLDLTDYLAKRYSVTDQDIIAVLASPKFRAVIAAFRAGLINLGYAAFFSWEDAKRALPDLSPSRLIDVIRFVTRRSHLDAADPRHISIDTGEALAAFPGLFKRMDYTKLQEYAKEYLEEMGDFAASHPLRRSYRGTAEDQERSEYAEYWFRSSSERIKSLISDRRVMAGLDAMSRGRISYGAFLELVYGDGRHVLFPELDWHLTGLVLGSIVQAINRGEIPLLLGLEEEFPEFYKFYHPEAFGLRRGN